MSIQSVAIIGKGMIGISNAVLFTGNGIPTTVLAMEPEKGLKRYRAYYQDLVSLGLVTERQAATCEQLLTITTSYSDLANEEIFFESVLENLEIKHKVHQQIEASCPKLKAIASTSSAISPADLAKGVTAKEKIMVAHPYYPPHIVPCVELVKNEFTDPAALETISSVLEYCGREVCKLNKPAPGFIANRLQHALYREAVYMVEQGITSPEDIDKCIRSSWGPRYTSLGLFEHFDYAGLDLIASIDAYLYPDLCRDTTVQTMIKERVDRGDLGYKTGVGVYDWRNKDMEDYRKRVTAPYLKNFNWKLPQN